MNKKLLILVLNLILIVNIAYAYKTNSSNYTFKFGVSSGSGINTSSPNYETGIFMGVSGNLSSGNYGTCIGFLCTLFHLDGESCTSDVECMGGYCCSNICQSTPCAAAPSAPSGPGGGGAATPAATILARKSFKTSLGSIKTKLKAEKSTVEQLTIKNTGDAKLDFSLSVEALEGFVLITKDSFSLNANEETVIDLRVFAGKEPGLYTGSILIQANGLKRKIPIILEIITEKVLFDVKLDLPPKYREILQGENLKAQISLFSMATAKKVDVILYYLIKDFKNNLIAEESETFAVENQASFTKTFHTEDLVPGSYVVAIEARYADSFALSSDTFKVVEKILPIPTTEKLFTILLAFVVALVIIYFLLKMRKIEMKKQRKH